MTDLRDLQSEFATALLDPDLAPPADVTSHTARSLTRRFDVYRNNILVSVTDALETYFPVVSRLVGAAFFRGMAREYIRIDPPRSPILSQYCADFPAFISQFEPVQDLPYLGDVARLEWLVQRAFHASDRTPLAASDLEQIPKHCAADIVFELHPSAAIMASPFAVVSIWKTNACFAEVRPINLVVGGEAALVLRPALEVKVIQLPDGNQAFLRALRESVALGEAATYALARDETFNFQLALAGLIEAGTFAAFEVRQRHCSNPWEHGSHECSRRHLH
jgi:hypothetical protein